MWTYRWAIKQLPSVMLCRDIVAVDDDDQVIGVVAKFVFRQTAEHLVEVHNRLHAAHQNLWGIVEERGLMAGEKPVRVV